ncbi:hypothetical protein GF380_05630 [Candidatus Uhrbacteria bacterium]|nr:hypothetical protein [Candidatus Uhrbacteria bacterium]MBD3284673.1 hypothetical protein [Candidatus Uhrbacteria bacterium]
MATFDELKAMCMDEHGQPKEKTECRALLINHLILEELMDVDEAEDLTDDTLTKLDLWTPEMEEKPKQTGTDSDLSTDD